MRIYVSNNGMKSLFHEGPLTKETWNEVVVLIKEYFGWRKLACVRTRDGVCIMDGERIQRLRKIFKEAVV